MTVLSICPERFFKNSQINIISPHAFQNLDFIHGRVEAAIYRNPSTFCEERKRRGNPSPREKQ
jgi:hypothetical protein